MSVQTAFSSFDLSPQVILSLSELGYEEPTPIQQQSIPVMLAGRDLLAQAQTGTGKTAAFALPILSKINVAVKKTQALIVAPTRELAIQVAEAFQSYAKHIEGFHVVSIYGGQDYSVQLRALKRSPQVIVGTPGRLMDHMRRKSLSIADVKTVVLDEADEMLKMGFVEDIEWILSQIKQDHQTGLFSATMPTAIKKIADQYLNNPEKITISSKTSVVETIEQCYTVVAKDQKLALLTRFLESENIEAAIVFARTKNESSELAEKLQARGYAAAPINGDMNQALRKKTIERMKAGSLDILVATDVAARGIDIERISHVFNFDIPYDAETYIHRIGRTGRAGRSGKSWLFVTPRERYLLQDIERAVKKSMQEIFPPSINDLREKRHEKRVNEIALILEKAAHKLDRQDELLNAIIEKTGADMKTIAAAFAHYIQRSEVTNQDEAKVDKVQLEDARRGGGNSRRRSRPSSGRKSNGGGSRGSSKNNADTEKKAMPWERRERRRRNK